MYSIGVKTTGHQTFLEKAKAFYTQLKKGHVGTFGLLNVSQRMDFVLCSEGPGYYNQRGLTSRHSWRY